MHEKTIDRSHSVLMHACMAKDLVQSSINRPTDIGAECALLEGTQQTLACFETGFIPRAILGIGRSTRGKVGPSWKKLSLLIPKVPYIILRSTYGTRSS